MRQILPGVYCFTGLLMGRVYLITAGDGATLIDAGLAIAARPILRQLERAGLGARAVRRILITHAHPDHVGGLPELAAATGAEVWASREERPVIEGEVAVPTPPRERLAGLARRMVPPPTRMRPTKVAREIGEGETLPELLDGLQVLHTPGHAPGHLSFWEPGRRLLFCGDVIMRLPAMRLPVAAFTVDMEENRRSVRRLAELAPEIVCFGHGRPLRGAAPALRRFADRVAAG